MPQFGKVSTARLLTCHGDLQAILLEVIKDFDFAVICGHRGEVDQMVAYESGKSQLPWPKSPHNRLPSMAVDVAPYPIDWNDRGAFYLLAGWIECTAARLYREGKISHKVRLGADWDGYKSPQRSTKNQKFHDLPHVELVE